MDIEALEIRLLMWMMGRPTMDNVNKSRSEIAAEYAKAKTTHNSFPLGSNFVFATAILKK